MRRGVKQKRLQLPTKFSDVVVRLANPGWQTVPEPWSSGPWNAARVDVGRLEPATVGVRDKLAVVYKNMLQLHRATPCRRCRMVCSRQNF